MISDETFKGENHTGRKGIFDSLAPFGGELW